VVKDEDYIPEDPKELCGRIFVTCYMGTSNSSDETRLETFDILRFIDEMTDGRLQCLERDRLVFPDINKK
jgi:hypothetical protein